MRDILLTKTKFLQFHRCSAMFWFSEHKPAVLSEETIDGYAQRLIEQGFQVEEMVKGLFDNPVHIRSKGQEAVAETKRILQKHTEATFIQAKFSNGSFFAAVDVMEWNSLLDAWDIYEIKASSSKDVTKEEHLIDATYQKLVLEACGYNIANVYLVEVDKTYVKQGPIDIKMLFKISEITTEAIERSFDVRNQMDAALEILSKDEEPAECQCRYLARKNHCRAFDYLYPQVPAYSIYDIARIGSSGEKLKKLVDQGIYYLQALKKEHGLTQIQWNQVITHQTGERILKKEEIDKKLRELVYPLYYLDYESSSTAIPKFDGEHPYQQVVFQYSLHIQTAPGGQIEHKEYLHLDLEPPFRKIAEKLRAEIGDKGSVVVWNDRFEKTCNKELAEIVPEYAVFLEQLNTRMFDLERIFSKQFLVDPGFKGRTSLKSVVPILCPELSYDSLEIQSGTQACVAWERIMFETLDQDHKQAIIHQLLAYCDLDTWSMVKVIEKLTKLVQ